MSAMKLAFSTLGCPAWSPERVAEEAARGWDGVELRLAYDRVITPSEDAAALKKAYRGVAVCCLDASSRFASDDPGERCAQLADARAMLGLASELECGLLRVFGGTPEPGCSERDYVCRVASALSELAVVAESAGVCVVLETHDSASAGRLAGEIAHEVDSPWVGVLWDTHHPYRMGESPSQTLGYVWPFLRHTHVKDAVRSGDSWTLVELGEGEVPVAEALSVWSDAGYDGWVSLEWEKKWHPELADPETVLPAALAWLRGRISA